MKRYEIVLLVLLFTNPLVIQSTFAQQQHDLFTSTNRDTVLRNLDSVTQKSRSMEDKAFD